MKRTKTFRADITKYAYSMDYCPDELQDVPILSSKDYLHPKGGTPSDRKVREMGASMAINSNWAEFGVGMGTTARHLLGMLPEDGKLSLFDGFKGIPDPWRLGDTQWHPAGTWKFPRRTCADLFRSPATEVIDGWYNATLPGHVFEKQLGLVHIDCDVYSSTRDVLMNMDPFIGIGTVLIFDELYGYQYYEDHEYKALCEWREATGKRVEWHGRSRFEAVGVVA